MPDVTCKRKVYDGVPPLARWLTHLAGQRILDVGCGTGGLGAELAQRGNTVYGLTISECEAALARQRLAEVIVGDLETMEALPFSEHFFDTVIFADVLEHLRDPKRPLELIKPYLKPSAQIIASIPNVANIIVRWNLLRGRFDYEEYGILDNTHLRFFTFRTAKELLTSCGFQIEMVKFTHWNWELPPMILTPLRWVDRDWEAREWLIRTWPGLFATQFVIYTTFHGAGAMVYD